MTSDRGTTGKAEMKPLDTSLVPPKTAVGLNPNAHVFQSKGAPATPSTGSDGGGVDWPLTPEQSPPEEGAESPPEGNTAASVTSAPSDQGASPAPSEPVFALINGDEGGTPKMTSGIVFPPSPESPSNYNGFESTNGLMAAEPFEPSDDQLPIGEGPEFEDQLREMLKTQLEYYFSRENLANDTYLVSQMDADQYVPISTVANFNQVKRLTSDMDLVIEVLRESGNVQVDEKGEKVRPLHKRCVVILREIPESTPVEDVSNLFSGENCPKFVSCEFAHNNNWYVTFNSDEDAQRAYQYLREEVRAFQGKPIMARIKAKPLVHSTFLPKNGFKQQFSTGGASTTTTTPQVVTSESNQVFNQQRFSPFSPVAASTQYIISQQGYPFFPPNTVVQAPWPTASPMTFFDPGTAFTVNGYTPAATFKLSGSSSRHGFQSNRNRNPKPHRGGGGGGNLQDRDHRDHSNRDHRDHRDHGHRGNNDHRDRNQREWNDHYEHHHNSTGSRLSPRVSGPTAHEASALSASSSRRHDGYHGNNAAQDSSRNHHASTPSTTSHSHSATASAACTSSTTVAVARAHGSSTTDHVGSTNGTSSASLSTATATTTSITSRQISDSKDSLPRYEYIKNYRSRRRGLQDLEGAKNMRQPGSVSKDGRSAESPKFELEATSFPPLPGATPGAPSTKTSGGSTEAAGIWENKMSDVVKGTVKPSTKPVATVVSSPPPMSSNSPASTTTVVTATTSQTNSISSSTSTTTVSKTETKDSATSHKDKEAVTKEKESVAKEEAVAKETVVAKEAKKVVSVSTATSPATVAHSLACSLPTPPQSPLKVSKVSKWTSTETVVSSKPAPPSTTSTTTQTTLSQSSTQVSCSSVGSQASISTVTTTTSSSNVTAVTTATTASGTTPASAAAATAASASSSKLSYAQMVARKKEAEKQQQQQQEAEQAQNNVSNGPSTKPAALRDQSQLTSRPASSSSKSSTSDNNFVRKDYRTDESSLRPNNNGRRAKENRDRRGPPLDSKDRFRERRRSDRDDLRPAYASK